MKMWCRKYSLVLFRVSDEWRAAADEWRGGLEVRRAVDVAVEKSDCKPPSPLSPIYVFQKVHPSSASPSFPLLLHSPLQHFSFNTFYLLVSDFPAPFMPFDFGSSSSTLLLFSLLLFLSSLLTG